MQDRLPQYALATTDEGPFAIGAMNPIQQAAFTHGLGISRLQVSLVGGEWEVTAICPRLAPPESELRYDHPYIIEFTKPSLDVALRYVYGAVLSIPEGADQ